MQKLWRIAAIVEGRKSRQGPLKWWRIARIGKSLWEWEWLLKSFKMERYTNNNLKWSLYETEQRPELVQSCLSDVLHYLCNNCHAIYFAFSEYFHFTFFVLSTSDMNVPPIADCVRLYTQSVSFYLANPNLFQIFSQFNECYATFKGFPG